MLSDGPMIDVHRVTLAAPDDFDGWREAARDLAEAGVPASAVLWQVAGGEPELFGEERLASLAHFRALRDEAQAVEVHVGAAVDGDQALVAPALARHVLLQPRDRERASRQQGRQDPRKAQAQDHDLVHRGRPLGVLTQRQAGNAEHGEFDGQHVAFLARRKVARCPVHRADGRIGKGLGVKLRRCFGVAIVP